MAIDEEGWLHTGDLCYIDRQGLVYVVDRIKELIKYKAYQVMITFYACLNSTMLDNLYWSNNLMLGCFDNVGSSSRA